MLKFKSERVSNHIIRIYAFSTELMYLVFGRDKDVLIDTGSGFGSLLDAVDELRKLNGNISKPLDVLLTHGHVDHAMGAMEFLEAGCDIFLNKEDEEVYKCHSRDDFRKAGVSMLDLSGQDEFDEVADYIPSVSFDDFKDIKEGDRFDLGDVTITAYSCPGHTKGTLVFLIEEMGKDRYLLTGDACNTFTFLFDDYSLSVDEYEENLKALKEKLHRKYDKILISHGDGRGYPGMIEDVIQVCEDIKSGDTVDIPHEFMGSRGYIAKAMDFRDFPNAKGNIVYNKNHIYR